MSPPPRLASRFLVLSTPTEKQLPMEYTQFANSIGEREHPIRFVIRDSVRDFGKFFFSLSLSLPFHGFRM